MWVCPVAACWLKLVGYLISNAQRLQNSKCSNLIPLLQIYAFALSDADLRTECAQIFCSRCSSILLPHAPEHTHTHTNFFCSFVLQKTFEH